MTHWAGLHQSWHLLRRRRSGGCLWRARFLPNRQRGHLLVGVATVSATISAVVLPADTWCEPTKYRAPDRAGRNKTGASGARELLRITRHRFHATGHTPGHAGGYNVAQRSHCTWAVSAVGSRSTWAAAAQEPAAHPDQKNQTGRGALPPVPKGRPCRRAHCH